MHIRRFLPENMAGVTALEHNLGQGWSVDSVRQEIDRPSGLQLVACGDYTGTVIGWCCGFQIGEEEELLRIAVARPERLKGVASALLAQFEKECVKEKVSTVFLEVAKANVAARRLYARFSYIQVGNRKGYYSQPVDDALVMNKILL